MHTRQGGAAHVPMMFFILLLIMFLGAMGFAYVKLTENGDLIKQRDEARTEAQAARERGLLIEHYIEDIGRVIGKQGKYEGRPESKSVYGKATIDFAGLMNPADVKKLMEDACSNAKVSQASSLENVLTAMVTRMSQLDERTQNAEREREKAIKEKGEIDSAFAAAKTAQAELAAKWNQDLEQARADFEAGKQSKDGTIAQLNQNLNDKRNELATTTEAAKALEMSLRKDLANKDMHNSALIAKDRMRDPPDVADGKIIVARTGLPTAFINLGKKDLLQPGTIFRIKNPNSDAVKGYATVTRVEDERAEVSLHDVVAPNDNAVAEGDLLFNEIYSPRLVRTIYLMGRFSTPYEKAPLTVLLKRLGNKVVDKMGPGVDTVILGDNPLNEAGDGFAEVKESQEYKEAFGLGVEFAPLKKIRDLIKL